MLNMKRLRNSEALQVISVVFACIFPVMLFAVSWEITLQSVWIAFYSSVFLWIVHRSKAVKIIFSIINFLAAATITWFFLMGGIEIIPGIILKAIIPFWRNPWFF